MTAVLRLLLVGELQGLSLCGFGQHEHSQANDKLLFITFAQSCICIDKLSGLTMLLIREPIEHGNRVGHLLSFSPFQVRRFNWEKRKEHSTRLSLNL